MSYYMVKITLKDSEDNGKGKPREKKWVESYLVDDVCVMGVEAKITKEFEGTMCDWKITSITESNVIKVIE